MARRMLQIILLVATTQLGRLKTEDVAVVAVGGCTRSGSRLLKTEDEWKVTAAKMAKRWIRRARVGPPEG